MSHLNIPDVYLTNSAQIFLLILKKNYKTINCVNSEVICIYIYLGTSYET